MAELNFGLLNPPGSQNIGNAFVQGMDQAAVARAQENQNALSQYALSKARREGEQQNQLYRDIQDPNFKLDVSTALRYGPQGMAALKMQQDAAAAALAARVKQSTLDTNTAELPGKQADAFQKVLKPYSSAAYGSQTVDEGVASVKAMYANPTLAAVLTKIKPLEQAIADTTAAFGDPKTMTQWQAHWGGITPEKLFDAANARRPNPAKDLLIPGPDGALVPNTALIGVQTGIRRAGASSNITKVNTYLPASEEAQRDFIKSTRITYDTLKQSPAMFANIEASKKLIPSASVFMGTGGEGMKAAASFLNNRLGMSVNTEGVKTAEELRSRLFQGILANLKKLDSQPSERQQAALEQALGNLNTDPNALSNVLDSYADTVRNNIDIHNAEVQSAISRGVKFPYDPIIKVPVKATKPDVYVRDANGVIRKQ